jgi:large subunit ribosomal protein L5
MSEQNKEKYVPRLKKFYQEKVRSQLLGQFGLNNPWAVPRLTKIVINIGVSEARENIKALDVAGEELAMITGQKPALRRAKKSISNFKLRQNMPIGLKVTLRGDRMYEFFDRLVNIAMPRIRDFQGLNPRDGFDGRGNFNLGLREQYIFPEINIEKSDKPRGMNITIVTTAKSDEMARAFLKGMGMPFKKDRKP